ncbi:MAG: MopE-related protein [Nannocystaceae bacterium]|nr:MopE-related protein [bacterium]
MKSSRSLRAAGLALFALGGCGTEFAEAEEGTDGVDSLTGVDTERDTDPVPTSATDDPTIDAGTDSNGTEDTDPGDSDDTDSGSNCPGEENPCGGCDDLPQTLGEPCNGCDDLAWECDGEEAVVCGGFDPASTQYWPDEDEDGFGDADTNGVRTCDGPPAGWVDNDADCRDDDEAVNPDATEVCNGLDDDCNGETDEAPTEFCDDVCCSFELFCDGTACVPKCEDEGDICGEGLDECCAAGEVCFANTCVTPGDDCEFTEECPVGQICAQSTGQCVPEDAAPDCEFIPPVGEFDPEIGGQWTDADTVVDPLRNDVVATPIVINLTDDNDDGVTDNADTPDIAFLTYDRQGDGCCNRRATLRIVSGQSEMDGSMTELGTINESLLADGYRLTNDAGIAAADLDGDGVPELVAMTLTSDNEPQGTAAFRRTSEDGSAWELLWHNQTYPTWDVHTRGGPVASIADLDADGDAEIVIGNIALNGQDGSLLWDGLTADVPMGEAAAGVGNNGFLGPSSAVADIDLDGDLEVAAGNTLYDFDGTILWSYDYGGTANSACHNGNVLPCDGFNAIANFDDDDEGEVVIIRRGEVFVLDTDGTELHRIALPVDDCPYNESGPPTIADFDGDGVPEIGTASADFYVVADPYECTGMPLPKTCAAEGILWQTPNQDCSSRVTASSVFDFEGDGNAEVVYADETDLLILDGRTGANITTLGPHDSHTRIEMPVIADVDNDGNAEIVVGENTDEQGIVVWEDASDNWVRTRRVWNQHAYAITHITEDGDVPAVMETNWLNERYNNFRQNVQPDGLFAAPDAVLGGNICTPLETDEGWDIDLSVLVRNDGALSIPAGTDVAIVLDDGMSTTVLLETQTSIALAPGQLEVLSLTLSLPAGVVPPVTIQAIVDPADEDSPNGDMNECNEDNNVADTLCALPG